MLDTLTSPLRGRGGLRRGLGWAALAAAVALVALIRFVVFSGSSPSSQLPHDRQAREAASLLAGTGDPRPPAPKLPTGRSAAALAGVSMPLPPERTLRMSAGVRLSGGPFLKLTGARQGSFIRLDGSLVGFERLPLPPWYQTMQPTENEYAPLAAGDVNGDGWPDVVAGTAYGVFLYRNLGGRFALQQIDFPQMRSWIISDVALVDLNGDGAPELFFCAWMHGCTILWNHAGAFSAAGATTLPRGSETAVASAAFADFDRDGRVDIVTGGSTALEWNFYPRTSTIVLWHNTGGRRFARRPLQGPHGETLSLLASDLTGSGWPDLYAANDFDEPDVVFRNQHGRLVATDAKSSPFPRSPMSTMSVDSGDIDNDGRAEIYADDIAYGGTSAQALQRRELAPGASCRASYQGAVELRRCLQLSEFQTAVIRSRDITSVRECTHFADAVRRRDCVAAGYLWNETFATLPKQATRSVVVGECARIPASLFTLHDACAQAGRNPIDYGQTFKALTSQTPQVANTNLLFAPGGSGYRDVTRQWGVGFGGWSWNAKFADLDNDGWQDLFITQGTRLRFLSPSNLLYRNEHGSRFVESAATLGLADHVPTGGSLFVDINQDGRLDIVSYPFALTPVVWGNDLRIAPGLELRLRDDRSSNRDAIGARVVIRAADGRQQMREIKASGGFESLDEPLADFGLGHWRSVAAISVRWPDGAQTTLRGLALEAGRYSIERLPR